MGLKASAVYYMYLNSLLADQYNLHATPVPVKDWLTCSDEKYLKQPMKVPFAIVLFYNMESRELCFVSFHFIMYFVGFGWFQTLVFPW